MRHELQTLEFWQERLKESDNPRSAIGQGYNWEKIDKVHKKIIQDYIKKGDKVLDAGCGIGVQAKWFSGENYIGIDFVPEFIEIAKKENPNKKFLLRDLKKPLPFKNGEFDWIILISVYGVLLHSLGQEEWDKIYKELQRVGGKVLFLSYNQPQIYQVGNPEIAYKESDG